MSQGIAMFRSGFGGIHIRPDLVMIVIVGYFFLAGTLGATVLFCGTAHWIRAVLGFGLCFIPALISLFIAFMMSMEANPNGPPFDEAVIIVVIWGIGPGLYAGIGGGFKRFGLVLPGVIAFSLPGLILGSLTMMTHYHGSFLWFLSLPVSGALFGYAVGRSEERECPTPPPQD